MEAQRDWNAHAAFMNALVDERFVVLGGPLGEHGDVLLIVRAKSPNAIATQLAQDPWSTRGLLTLSRIDPWVLRLGVLD